MARGVPFRLLVLLFLSLTSLSDVNAYPRSDFLEDGLEQELESSLRPIDRLEGENDFKPRREEALQKMQEILGIRSQSDNLAHRKMPPQFMMELYNTIADPSGVTRGRNPYNAKVVRSFVERDTTSSHFYFFNVSGLEVNESVLEAELHLYRKKTPSPTNFASPYYLIRVYQVLDDYSLDMPDLHRLLNVRYVSAHVSGWQVFNVKRAVLGWVSGEPNLGLLVTAQDLFEDEVSVEFSRRNDYRHGKQPILVLFNDDRNNRNLAADVAPQYYAYENQNDEVDAEKSARSEKVDLENDNAEYYRRHKRHHEGGQLEEVMLVNRHESELFQRQKKIHEEEENDDPQESRETSNLGAAAKRRCRDATSSRRRSTRIASQDDTKITRVLTSMDIYERAAFREKLGQIVRNRSLRRSIAQQQQQQQQHRSPRSPGDRDIMGARQSETNKTNECTRHELYVDFRDIGLSSSIIAPSGYSAYQCKGVCEPPLSQDQRPTNHATIQAIVHKLGLVEGVQRPCCVPTKLLRTSILFYDDNENVVLKMYDDMIADSCGCR